jgi:hypothetical protein
MEDRIKNMKFVYTWIYFSFILLVIMPINVLIILNGDHVLGYALIACQVPWLIIFITKKINGYKNQL